MRTYTWADNFYRIGYDGLHQCESIARASGFLLLFDWYRNNEERLIVPFRGFHCNLARTSQNHRAAWSICSS